jgi:hypothetical protein
MRLLLSPEQKVNYGVIISNDDELNKDDIEQDVYAKIKYVYDHLIKPFQIDIVSTAPSFKDRVRQEITANKSRSQQSNNHNVFYNKIKKEKKEKKQYKSLNGIKMTDFNEYIAELNDNSDDSNDFYDRAIEFKILVNNNNYLIKMFKLLKHINERGVYCYNNIITQTDNQVCVVELRKINYKYLHFNTTNGKIKDYINFDEDLQSFTTFTAKITAIKEKCNKNGDAIAYMNLSPSIKLPEYYDIMTISNPFNNIKSKTEYELFLDDATNFENKIEEKTDYVLFNSIPTLDFAYFLQKLILNNYYDLYYINIVSDTITDISNINITKNIKVQFDLTEKEIFP